MLCPLKVLTINLQNPVDGSVRFGAIKHGDECQLSNSALLDRSWSDASALMKLETKATAATSKSL